MTTAWAETGVVHDGEMLVEQRPSYKCMRSFPLEQVGMLQEQERNGKVHENTNT